MAVILAVVPGLTYLYFQWSDVYVYRPGDEPIISLLIGLGLLLASGLGVGLSLRSVTWRGYAVDLVRSAGVGCVCGCAVVLVAMLRGL